MASGVGHGIWGSMNDDNKANLKARLAMRPVPPTPVMPTMTMMPVAAIASDVEYPSLDRMSPNTLRKVKEIVV